MTWNDMTGNWGHWFRRMQARFPHLEDSAMPFLKQDRGRFEAYLAQTHDLTLNEARAELEDFLLVEALLRETSDLRVRA